MVPRLRDLRSIRDKNFGFSGRGPEKTRNPKFGFGSGRVRLSWLRVFSGRGPEGGQKFGSGRV